MAMYDLSDIRYFLQDGSITSISNGFPITSPFIHSLPGMTSFLGICFDFFFFYITTSVSPSLYQKRAQIILSNPAYNCQFHPLIYKVSEDKVLHSTNAIHTE